MNRRNTETDRGEGMQKPHAQTAEAVLDALETDPEAGLSRKEARRRLERYGRNRLRRVERKSSWRILVDQFKSMIAALLFAAGALSFALGEIVQGLAIFVALLVNGAIGFATELKATRSMEALRKLDRSMARARRDGKEREIEAEKLVPGDIVLLEAGEMVPADVRLIEASGLRLNESALTGESLPVGKTTDAIEAGTGLADRENMAFKGTSVSSGAGSGVVVATGMDTELGRISEMAEQAEGEETPLEKRLNRLSQRLLVVILVISALISVIGIVLGRDMFLMVETGVALVVAAVPEGLPIVASIALARGMWRLARRNALVERLSAVETLGATNVICTDKTGTLTENRMSLTTLALPDGEVKIHGEGDDGFTRDGTRIDPQDDPLVRAALEVSVLCNGARLGDGSELDERGTGDPLEIALLVGGKRAGLARDELLERLEELRREEFDPSVKMMATYHRTEDGVRVAVKGAPESVLEVSTSVYRGENETVRLDDAAREDWLKRNEDMAGRGLRALAVAEKHVSDENADPYEELTLIGLVGLVDPPRAEVRDAVMECRDAGIHVVMVTGDQPSTARAIAAEVGLIDDADDAQVVLGDEMKSADQLTEDERRELLKVPIFARFDPKQKLDLIHLYKKAGLVVAMTGDGVNDAPALKEAHIGVAMGQRGTEVARQASDMVLRDDSFASIVTAIRQGRAIFGNIRKFVVYMLSGNTGEIFAVSLLALLNLPLPLLPLQILYINIVSDVFPALAIGASETRHSTMKRPPRDPKEPIITDRHWFAIGGYGVLIGVSVLAVFWIAFQLGMSRSEAVTVSFLTFGFARLWHVFNMRDPGTSILKNEITLTPYVWMALGIGVVLLLAATYLPVLSPVLETEPPGAQGWALIAVGSLIPLLVGQLLKLERVRRLLPARLLPRDFS